MLPVCGEASGERGPSVVPLFGEPDTEGDPSEWGLGPADARDPFPLALLHFSFPVETPETTPAGRFRRLGTEVVWANTSSVSTRPGSEYVVDAEVVTARARLRFGLTDRVEIGLDVPFHYVGGGVFDGLADWTHKALGNGTLRRELLGMNDYAIVLNRDGRTTRVHRSSGSGDIAVGGKWRILDGGPVLPAVALTAWIKVPSSSSPDLGREGWDFALSILGSKRFGPLVLEAGAGAWATTDRWKEHIRYRATAGMAWFGAELGIFPGVSVELHTTIRSPLLQEASELSRTLCYIVGSLRFRRFFQAAGRVVEVEAWVGIIENYGTLWPTADFGGIFGIEIRP